MDDVNLTYPVEVLYAENVCIRLSTAIRIACIDDSGSACGIEYTDSEVDPFHNSSEVHSYFRIEATGGVSRAIKTVSDSVRLSLEKGKLKPLVLSTSFEDFVNLDDTWISAEEIETWCAARRIELGESWSRFYEQEHEILTAGADVSEARRRKAESPNFTEEFDKLGAEWEKGAIVPMLEELAAYRSTTKRDRPEKPLRTTERDTLLTIIAVLVKAAKVPLDDYSKPGKAAGYIEGLTDEFGAHVSKRAIEDHLKKIPDALRVRLK